MQFIPQIISFLKILGVNIEQSIQYQLKKFG